MTSVSRGVSGDGRNARGISIDPTLFPPHGANPHYMDHLVAIAEVRDVQACEDLYASNGTKLLAKGTRVDARIRERLLEHKLNKPLEDCVTVSDAVSSDDLGRAAEALLDRHSMLRELCSQARPDTTAGLTSLHLSPAMQSLLTLFAEHQPNRLEHAVGVALLAQAFGRLLQPGGADRQHVLGLAGLFHDIGELYIDPTYLRKGTPLDAAMWKHIVIHPLVADRVLRHVAGGDAAIADAVLHHHERLDGFGYPHGKRGAQFPLSGQIVATSEWLMGLLDSGLAPRIRASVASRLMPGEFNRQLLDAVAQASMTGAEEAPSMESLLENWAPSILRIAGTLGRFREVHPWIDEQVRTASPGLKLVLELSVGRLSRIQTAFSSTGLDAHAPQVLMSTLQSMNDKKVHLEVVTVARELEWRLLELDRESRLRAGMLREDEQAIVEQLSSRLRGDTGVPTTLAGSSDS